MAGASDKARFYLEQSVPELLEFSRKDIFTKVEISSIVKKRSGWEHKLNARGSRPSDYARYAEYEMNLETLRRKRVQRLGVKTSSHTGQRRIFFILDRAIRKYPGDIALWMQYINFARMQKSNRKVSQILTRMLRLHPTKSEMWIYAAKYALEENGDMAEARSNMQRALRFCKTEGKLWVEYARLEMMWIAKIARRRKILGLDEEKVEEGDEESVGGIGEDEVALPKVTAEYIIPHQRSDGGVDESVLEKLTTSPALSGAIPMAIFDAAMMQFKEDEQLRLEFFDMIAKFSEAPCTEKISDHIIEAMKVLTPKNPAVLIRLIQQPVISHSVTSYGFATRFGLCLDRMEDAFQRLIPDSNVPKTARARGILAGYVIEWLLSFLEAADLDPAVRKVLLVTLRKVWTQFEGDIAADPYGRGADVTGLISKLRAQGLRKIVEPATAWATRLWPEEAQLSSLNNGIVNQ